PVHYQDEDKEWQEVDYSLEETDTGTNEEGYETTEKTGKEERIKFSKKFKEGKTVSIKQTDYPLSWGFVGAEKSEVVIEAENVSEAEEKKGHNERFLTMESNTQTLTYPDVYEGVDAEYKVGLSGIKENLILKEAGTQTEFEILYDIGKLNAVQEDERSIQLMKGEEVIYQIQAPYMKDANGEYSDQLTLEIKEQKNKKLRVALSADEKWLKDENRVYPVIIDPVVQTKTTKSAIDSTFIASGKASTNFSGKLELLVGKESSEYKNCRTLVKFTLPKLKAGDVVVDAQLNLLNWKSGFYSTGTPNLRVHAHQIEGSWTKSGVTWNNRPAFDDKVLDYDYIGATGSPQWRIFNVTEAVRSWYDKTAPNRGIMIKSYTESGSYADTGVKAYFWPERYNEVDDAYPTLQIVYRNNKGLEDYWNYTSLSAGTAGTAHINDYTGNLVLIHEDTATSGNLVPVTLQHVYNGYQLGVQQKNPYPRDGKGWKMSMQQTLKASSNYGLTGTAKTNYPYAYEDGDGTVHFFYKKTENGSTKYLDEDGLDLRMTIQSSADTKTITDKDGNKLVFNYYGNLRYIKDASGNTATLDYKVYDDTDRVLNKITDGAGHEILINHDAENYWLESITDTSGRTTTYEYGSVEDLGDGYLTKITYPDGTFSTYTYDNEGALETAVSSDGSGLKFYYTLEEEGKRVWKVEEFGTDGSIGQTLTFDRSEYNTTVLRTSGQDDIFENEDDLLITYQFDNYGRTVGSLAKTQDEHYGGEILTYTEGKINSSGSNIKQVNKISDSAYAGKNVVNYLKNHGAEKSGSWDFSPAGTENTGYTGTVSTEQKKFGAQSLQITGTENATAEEGCYTQNITGLETGKAYTLSGYVKTSGVTKEAGEEEDYGVFLSLNYKDSQQEEKQSESEYLQGTTDIGFEDGWRRISVTVEIPEGATDIQAGLHLKNASGTVYFDGIQLEEGSSYNAYNLFENAGFEVVTEAGKAENWTTNSFESGDGPTTEETFGGARAIKVKGKGSKDKYIYQQVPVTG
ncbi:MAG: RHS repeat protein, partial [Firmicutes bacterium]|nr:RHS repeat protein [Bacillota bacterium]